MAITSKPLSAALQRGAEKRKQRRVQIFVCSRVTYRSACGPPAAFEEPRCSSPEEYPPALDSASSGGKERVTSGAVWDHLWRRLLAGVGGRS